MHVSATKTNLFSDALTVYSVVCGPVHVIVFVFGACRALRAAEFFDLISKAQSNRADDQRGLLNKSDLQLPDFLRLSPNNPTAPPSCNPEPLCSTPNSRNTSNAGFPSSSSQRGNKGNGNHRGIIGSGLHLLSASHQSQSLDSALCAEYGGSRKARPHPSFPATVSPIQTNRTTAQGLPPGPDSGESIQMLEEDTLSDLTLVGEADINSPSLNYITPSSLCSKPLPRPLPKAQDGRPSSGTLPV